MEGEACRASRFMVGSSEFWGESGGGPGLRPLDCV